MYYIDTTKIKAVMKSFWAMPVPYTIDYYSPKECFEWALGMIANLSYFPEEEPK
jgi:hypothetical protein